MYMDSSVRCLTLPFADGGSAVYVVHWYMLCTRLLLFCGCPQLPGTFACCSICCAHGRTDLTWMSPSYPP